MTSTPGLAPRHNRQAVGDLAHRTFVVTGANTGIGRATALALARRGARVLLACRSEAKARGVLDEIAAGPAGCGAYLPLDLADLDSVRACARMIVEQGEPVHVLVNNAGVVGGRGGVTAQGFERTFGVNHLGPFLLTSLLLDHLRASRPARVVNVASRAHLGAQRIDFDALRRPTRTRTGLAEYQVSKLCNVLFTQELARRLDSHGVSAYAVHPGVVATDIWRRVPRPVRWWMTFPMASAEDGAAQSLHCATAPLPGPSGSYFENREVREASRVATPELAAELWRRSEEWTTP